MDQKQTEALSKIVALTSHIDCTYSGARVDWIIDGITASEFAARMRAELDRLDPPESEERDATI